MWWVQSPFEEKKWVTGTRRAFNVLAMLFLYQTGKHTGLCFLISHRAVCFCGTYISLYVCYFSQLKTK
jgi:hypothetical protein